MPKFTATIRIFIKDRNDKILDIGEMDSLEEIEAIDQNDANSIWAHHTLASSMYYAQTDALKMIRKKEEKARKEALKKAKSWTYERE